MVVNTSILALGGNLALGEKTHPSVVCITLFANDLGESLHWDAEGGLLYWIDAWKGVVHSYDPATDRMRQTGFADALGGRPIGSIACGDGGGMISGVRGGFYELDPATGDARFVATVETDRPATNRLNDGKCDRAGRFWCASINTDHHTPSGALWRLNQECDPVMVQDGLIAGNGIAWSPDSRSMYLADTIAGRYGDTTSISRQGRSRTGDSSSPSTPLAALPMALPWMRTATTGPRSSGGGGVAQFDQGKLMRHIRLPVSNPTMCAFGGPDFDILYVTSASRFPDDTQRVAQPQAGHLLPSQASASAACLTRNSEHETEAVCRSADHAKMRSQRVRRSP